MYEPLGIHENISVIKKVDKVVVHRDLYHLLYKKHLIINFNIWEIIKIVKIKINEVNKGKIVIVVLFIQEVKIITFLYVLVYIETNFGENWEI